MVKLILKNESDIIFLPRNKGKQKWKDFHQCVTPIVYEIKKKKPGIKRLGKIGAKTLLLQHSVSTDILLILNSEIFLYIKTRQCLGS